MDEILLKRKNSYFDVYGAHILWGAGFIFFLFSKPSLQDIFCGLLIILGLSLIKLYFDRNNDVQISFYDSYLVASFNLLRRKIKFPYSSIKEVKIIYTKVIGIRLRFIAAGEDGRDYTFSIYNPDKDLINFVDRHIKGI